MRVRGVCQEGGGWLTGIVLRDEDSPKRVQCNGLVRTDTMLDLSPKAEKRQFRVMVSQLGKVTKNITGLYAGNG